MENIIDPTVVSDFDYVMPEKLLYIRAEWTQCDNSSMSLKGPYMKAGHFRPFRCTNCNI